MLKLIKNYIPPAIKKMVKFFWNDILNFIDYIQQPFYMIKEYQIKKTWLSKNEINNYRKTIKIYDIFTFFDELDLLEIRLNILDQYVDYFIIIEATETFSGKEKPLHYAENKERFKKWHHKMIHFLVNDMPKDEDSLRKRLCDGNLNDLDKEIIISTLTSDNVLKGNSHWLREFYQKESVKKALVELKDNDICFVSDVDEIWNPDVVIDYTENRVFKFKQVAYFYYLNNRSNDYWITGWVGSIATKYKNIKHGCINHLRVTNKNKYIIIRNGGWHFTFQGGADKIRAKLESYGHQEFNTESIKSKIENVLQKNKDYRGRNLRFWKDESNLPKYILDNKEKYKHMLKSNDR